MTPGRSLYNGEAVPLKEVPCLPESEFRQAVIESVKNGGRIAAFFAVPSGDGFQLFSVIARSETGLLSVASAMVGDSYAAISPECPQAQLFEREIAEQWRIEPKGHKWLKPVRFQRPLRGGKDLWPRQSKPECGVMDYFQMTGEEVHEVAVGPVHAGIIEPGHFRFQCHGETVYHLEISLGYQHRGVERALLGGPDRKTLQFMQTLAGDTTIGHTMACCHALEALGQERVPARAQVIRGIALELERMANHIGDLGALAGDVGYLPTMSFCGRIRGDVLNLTAALCGNRFGRGLVVDGGVDCDIDDGVVQQMRSRLEAAIVDAEEAIGLLWESPSVLARFEGTGPVDRPVAMEIGLVGVAARASGVQIDTRHDYPFGIFKMVHLPVAAWNTGDVFARAFVRWQEIRQSATFVLDQLRALPSGPACAGGGDAGRLPENHLAVSLIEGWRGEICHVAVTDKQGKFGHYKVVDPSFHNWFGLAYALRNQQISDFPLCNKSFNLSYCGHDL
ncbi:MAG: hydrogenase [Myxococcota bacterium]|jgi:Ni,Fe-hydrogenase III large subunit